MTRNNQLCYDQLVGGNGLNSKRICWDTELGNGLFKLLIDPILDIFGIQIKEPPQVTNNT